MDTKARVIDPDYTGTLKIILHNFGTKLYTINKGDRVVQLVVERYAKPNIQIQKASEITTTKRGNQGFGSTGLTVKSADNTQTNQHTLSDIDLTLNVPEYTIDVRIQTNSKHPTLGLITKDTNDGILIVTDQQSTPSAKIPQWRKTIKGGYLRQINGQTIKQQSDMVASIKSHSAGNSHITCTIAMQHPIPIHPDTGIPQLHFDQIGIIDRHMHTLRHNEYHVIDEAPPLDNGVQVNKTMGPPRTRRHLMKQPDWDDWFKSEHLQLDQYQTQNMFSEPTPLPTDMTDVNVLPMIWTYLTKTMIM